MDEYQETLEEAQRFREYHREVNKSQMTFYTLTNAGAAAAILTFLGSSVGNVMGAGLILPAFSLFFFVFGLIALSQEHDVDVRTSKLMNDGHTILVKLKKTGNADLYDQKEAFELFDEAKDLQDNNNALTWAKRFLMLGLGCGTAALMSLIVMQTNYEDGYRAGRLAGEKCLHECRQKSDDPTAVQNCFTECRLNLLEPDDGSNTGS